MAVAAIAVLGIPLRVFEVAVFVAPPWELVPSGNTAGEHTQVWDRNMRE